MHRGAELTWDISADLDEFARTDVAVVCAGAKAILDLAKTMEYLETKGVPVIGYRTSELPAFYSRESGVMLSQRADDPMEIARLLHAKWSLGLSGGAVIANPVPIEYSMTKNEIDAAIEQALEEPRFPCSGKGAASRWPKPARPRASKHSSARLP